MRSQLDDLFEQFARGVVRRKWLAIAGCLLLAGSLASQIPKLGIETAVETFLTPTDPARIEFEAFREQFGREDLIVIAIQPPNVFDLGFLERLRDLHDEIEAEVPNLDDVKSLINVRSTYGSESELIVEDLLEEFPETPEAVAALRQRVSSNPLYVNTVVSEDATMTTLVATLSLYPSSTGDALEGFEESSTGSDSTGAAPRFLNGMEINAAVSGIREIAARYEAEDFQLFVAGAPVLQEAIAVSMQHDIRRFVGIMMGTVALVLLVLFRRLSGILMPLVVVVLSLASALGSMATFGVPMATPTQVLPTFLLAVGTGSAVHILKIFYLQYDAGDDFEDAIAGALRHTGVPVAMTSLTTAGGLLSFLAAGMTPIIHLGIFAPLGVMLALLYCLVLLPALLATLPLRRKGAKGTTAGGKWLENTIVSIGDYSTTHPWQMVAAAIAIIAVSITGIVRLEFTNDVMSWLAPDHPLLRGTDVIDSHMGGSMTLEVVADTGRVGGVKEPEFLMKLDELKRRIEPLTAGEIFVGKTIAITDIVKEIHQALNENRPEFYAIPDAQPLVSQELLLFENSGTDDLEDVVDTQFQLARFTVKVPYVDPILIGDFIDPVESVFRDIFGEEVGLVSTGFMGMIGTTVKRVTRGMGRSYMLALAIITPLMILLIGDLRGGLVSMVPNLTPIFFTLGLMGWLGVTIDLFTMMIGSVAIGLAVDDTIHFIHGFRREFERLGDVRAAVRETLETTGRALLVTTVVLSCGFLVFALSEMKNLFYFGLFTSLTIVNAFLIDISITPALMGLVTRKPAADDQTGR